LPLVPQNRSFTTPPSLVLQSSGRLFLTGYCMQATIRLLGQMGTILRRPSHLITVLKHSDNARLGAFLAAFTGIFKVRGQLRYYRGKRRG
jgi:hypothetical protein